MSYKCEVCKGLQEAGTKLNLVPTQIRNRLYRNKNDITNGFETAKEVKVCPSCITREINQEIVGIKEDKEYVYKTRESERRPKYNDNRM